MKKSTFLKSSSVNIVLKFAAVGIIFLFQSLLSKIISVEDYSMYAKFTTYSGYMALVLSFGMTASLLYFSENEKDFKSNYFGAFIFYIFISVPVIVISTFFSINNHFFTLVVIFSLLLNLIGISLSFYQFKNNFIKYAIFGFLQSLAVISVLIIIKIFNLVHMHDIFKVYIGTHFIFLCILLYSIYAESIKDHIYKITFKLQNILYGTKTIGLLILAQFIYIADFILVDFYLEDKYVAYYFVALVFSKIVFIMADTVGNIIFTLYAQSRNQDKKHIDENVYMISSFLFGISIIFLISFIFLGKTLLVLVYELSYLEAYESTVILIAGTQGMIIYKFLSRKLIAENSWKVLYITVITAASINIVLNLILIPIYGITGAAVSSMIAYWVCGILLVFLHKERLVNYLFRFDLLVTKV